MKVLAEMDWQQPQFLYLILPLCVAWFALALHSERRRQRARESFVAQAMWSRVLPELSKTRFWIKLALREVAIVAGLIALAGPQFGTQLEIVIPRGSDLYILIDVSRSMLADDVSPTRLDRAKADVSALVNRLEGERVGLIAFAGQAVVKCPLTVDYDSFRRALNELDPNSAPRGGTAIGDAIRKAIEVFNAKAERDQAVLLITDGDDQESYPLEAATVAAERKVTIFTVGLGDSDKGARVPQKNSATFTEHEGQQVWSKLQSKLLEEIALRTSGVYIPAGTRAYDLGELYATHLQGRKGDDEAGQQRIRKSERFQIFLALSLVALLADLLISPFRVSKPQVARNSETSPRPLRSSKPAAVAVTSLVLLMISAKATAGESQARVREGLNLYHQQKFEEAGKEFAAAGEVLDKEKSEKAAVAAFDEACAWHRKGDKEKARDRYLKAGLSQDRAIATASHFNLGTMSAENARTLAGEEPDEVPAEKRQEILEELKQAVASYRHCLEIQPEHAQSRRNLELVRNWIKYYSDRWREIDRQKKREETNLIQFLEFLMQSQSGLKEAVRQLPDNVPADAFAELKRAQDELSEEIPYLKEKIASELSPRDPQTGTSTNEIPKEIQEGITLLQSWADKAGDQMGNASRELSRADSKEATALQQSATDELDQIWDAVIPFQPLLTKELADQTTIAEALIPEPAPSEDTSSTPDSVNVGSSPPLTIDDEQLNTWVQSQEKTLRKARLLTPKAEAELSRVENTPVPEATVAPQDPAAGGSTPQPTPQPTPQVDPDQVKAGLRKAIELSPKAVEAMEKAVEQLQKNDAVAAAPHAEEARRIFEEIQNAQPKNEQQDQDKQDQDKDKEQKQDESKDQKDQDQKKKDDQKKDDDNKEKKDDQKQDQKKDDKQKDKQKNDPSKKSDGQQDPSKQPEQKQVSQDRIEEALRKVRERQQEKRERDREARARVIGRAPVDKDW